MLRLRSKTETVRRLVFASGVALSLLAEAAPKEGEAADAKPEIPKVKWINVAVEGEWDGHEAGSFKFDRKVFEGFVKTFREHPHFKAGEDGEGIAPVVPFDYEHVSELDPREGSVPLTGAPAPAWALDLQVRDSADGKVELWAKAKLGESIRNQIANDEYRWVSIAFNLESKDPKTDKVAGPRITSIAFTNHPFLRELAPLAASQFAAANSAHLRWYDPAGSVEQGFEYTRRCLGLPATADANEIKAEIGKLAALATSTDAAAMAPGTNVGEVFTDLRTIWGLTVTATVADVVAQIDKAVAQKATETAAASGANAAISNAAAAAVTPPAPPNLSQSNPGVTMTTPATKTLSAISVAIVTCLRSHNLAGTRMLADDEEVEEAVEEIVEETATTKKSLGDILASLGAADLDDALAKIPAIKAAAAQAGELKAMLDEALAMNEQVDVAATDADVAIAASSKQLPLEAVSASLSIHRSNFIAAEVKKAEDAARAANPANKEARASAKALFDARQNGRKAFFAHYGVAAEHQEKLLKGIAAGPGGVQLSVTKTTGTPPTVPVGTQLLRDGGNQQQGEKEVIDLSLYSGRTIPQRLLAWSQGRDEFKALSHDQRHSRLSAIRREADAGKGKFKIVLPANESAA